MVFAAIAVVIAAYFIGSVNFAVIFARAFLKKDVRSLGSGNAGATNVMRTAGFLPGILTFVCDALKGFLASYLGKLVFGLVMSSGIDWLDPIYGAYLCGIACMLGHVFPIFFQFKGGKGILSGGTIIIMIDWRVALVGWGGFILLFLLTRYVSLGSSSTGIDLPIVTWFVYRDWVLLVLICIMGGLILWKHRSNIARLISGTESKFSFHRKAAG